MRHAEFVQETDDSGFAVFTGRAPVAKLSGYAKEVAAYSGGNGSFSCVYDGDGECENSDEVITNTDISPRRIFSCRRISVFARTERDLWCRGTKCANTWICLRHTDRPFPPSPESVARAHRLSDAQLEEIMNRTYGPVKRRTYAESAFYRRTEV